MEDQGTATGRGRGTSSYSAAFYDVWAPLTRSSAERIVPIVVELLSPASVVDVGCGAGIWLASFGEHGVTDRLGLDGKWVDPERLEIPAELFRPVDLAAPFELERRFDLAVSLEVAEHLPPSSAATFVTSLTGLAPAVLFSAAIPGQGGNEHVNEQWPTYWEKLFAERGFEAIDVIRARVWLDDDVAFFYKQNAILFASAEALARHAPLRQAQASGARGALPLVHPEVYEAKLVALASLPRFVRDRARAAILRLRRRLRKAAGALR